MGNYFQTLVESKLMPVGNSGDDVIYRCPICEKYRGSGHLYVNYKRGVYNCFKCGYSGRSLYQLLFSLGYTMSSIRDAPIDLLDNRTRSKSSVDLLDDAVRSLSERKSVSTRDYSTSLTILTTYYNMHTKPLSIEAYNYLLSRGVSPDQISHYRISEGLDRRGEVFHIGSTDYIGRDYSGRIMVPSIYDNNRVSFYVARDYLGRQGIAKYLNPPKGLAYSSEDVWNLRNIKSRSVIICEGVFTAIAAGLSKYNAVATYGKNISARSNAESEYEITSQGQKLLRMKFDSYVIAYDADALDNTIATCEYLKSHGATVYYVVVPPVYGPKSDLSDFKEYDRRELIRSAKLYRSSDKMQLVLGI